MKIEEIRKRYWGEWVLIEYSKLDDSSNVLEGEVIAHSSNKEEVYRKLLNTQEKNVAI
ncbi:MAG TPA: hypothetical protein PKZ60_00205 [Candidatus Saccharicenans sp.]|nr:hypothetical protein [Candidatus Saccharicenans sp.]